MITKLSDYGGGEVFHTQYVMVWLYYVLGLPDNYWIIQEASVYKAPRLENTQGVS